MSFSGCTARSGLDQGCRGLTRGAGGGWAGTGPAQLWTPTCRSPVPSGPGRARLWRPRVNLSAGFQFSSGPGCTKSFPTALKQAWPVSPAPAVEVNVVRGSAGKERSPSPAAGSQETRGWNVISSSRCRGPSSRAVGEPGWVYPMTF